MNFNYSYRALLITSLLFGILFLSFKSITLSKAIKVQEEQFDVEYKPEEILPEEDLAAVSQKDLKVETNRAFNEAEKFIKEIEKERIAPTETTDGKTENEETSSDNTSGVSDGGTSVKQKVSEKKKEISNGTQKKDIVTAVNSSKKNSTVSYRLVDRSALDLPNPVYTCGSFGKVVINIEVSATGKVLKAVYNNASSTTTNQCLIDSALEYAAQARFSTSSVKTKQLGTITYHFQGQ